MKQGTIRRRIVDTPKQAFPRAFIYIEKLQAGVTSDVNCYYTFSDLTTTRFLSARTAFSTFAI